jgi:hypothetical protein
VRLQWASRGKHPLLFVVSTGRCGTQWLAHALRETYADLALVRHDPIGARYNLGHYLRRWDAAGEAAASPDAAAEIELMRSTTATRAYIDTGWASAALLPWLFSEFPGRVRVLHLVRHPVPTAISMVSLDMYAPERRRDEWAELATLNPGSPGVAQPGYAERWAEMTAYERCLFWWGEINSYAAELHQRYPEVPFQVARTEDMFDPASPALREITAFTGLPWRGALGEARDRRVDSWRFEPDEAINWRQVEHHPLVMRLMAVHGYGLEEISEARLGGRLAGAAPPKPWRPGGEPPRGA